MAYKATATYEKTTLSFTVFARNDAEALRLAETEARLAFEEAGFGTGNWKKTRRLNVSRRT